MTSKDNTPPERLAKQPRVLVVNGRRVNRRSRRERTQPTKKKSQEVQIIHETLLEDLPTEIMHHILGFLDIQSHYDFSLVSRRTMTLVNGINAYKELTKHVWQVLAVMKDTKVLSKYSPGLVFETLRSENCTSCRNPGEHLFLPTCEKVCVQCLREDRSLWVITPSLAAGLFNLSVQQVAAIPTMSSVPRLGVLANQYQSRSVDNTEIVSFRAVKAICEAEYRSVEASRSAADHWESHSSPQYDDWIDEYMSDHNRNQYLGPPRTDEDGDSFRDLRPSTLFPDDFAGAASIVVPRLSDNGITWMASSAFTSHLATSGVFEDDDQDLYWGRNKPGLSFIEN